MIQFFLIKKMTTLLKNLRSKKTYVKLFSNATKKQDRSDEKKVKNKNRKLKNQNKNQKR